MKSTAIASNGLIHEGRPNLDHKPSKLTIFTFVSLMIFGLGYMIYNLTHDITATLESPTTLIPYVLLGVALLIALAFEFVNGFHDTANAVATVIYTHSLPATTAVVWSGFFNFLGVLASSGLVAFGIIALLPVELILQVGSASGFAMIFALLIAAILWNLGTWFFGLPASSSHTLVGSIVGVGIANALLHGRSATAGMDWAQVEKVGAALLISPIFGLGLAAAVYFLMKRLFAKRPELFEAPEGEQPPPLWIRALLILTCTGVSFFHGSNDGQKGMGLIMLILVGVVPMTYGLNHAISTEESAEFAALAQVTAQELRQIQVPNTTLMYDQSRNVLTTYLRDKQMNPNVVPALANIIENIGEQARVEPDIKQWNSKVVGNIRNNMYLTSETIKHLEKSQPQLWQGKVKEDVDAFKRNMDKATKFIPTWVKVMVALALGLGTMVGWKRIVVTVGEKIGKSHLTYAQGASAELVAVSTIAAADVFGMPVSTTHVLSSGIAGTMVANKAGLQKSTVKNLLLAWVLTLPAAILLSGSLFWLFSKLFVAV
ncbi:inorganic phosphate transporter [Simonsiella muelleri]|uniref:inorganic phosphate transporter n=1 Tax=Simonsiella muelleri TaxID=72 RepID=UPI0023F202A4|nr:inorganic phosphate transporter [Simonsiella muelleri]